MKKLIVLFTLLFGLNSISAQSSVSFSRLISNTNYYLYLYNVTSPFDNSYAYRDIILSIEDEKELIMKIGEYNVYGRDSIDNFELMYFLQEKIYLNVIEIVKHDSFKKVDIKDYLLQEDLRIVISEDRMLYNFSLDEKSGGTYKSRISWMYYTEFDLDNKSFESIQGEPDSVNSLFDGDGYDEIYKIESNEGKKYVLTSSVKVCGTCYLTRAMLVSFNEHKFISEFDYYVFSRDWKTGVSYNQELNEIHVDYVTDDLTPFCGCEVNSHEKTELMHNENTVVKNCKCLFKFNGTNFDLITESSQILEE